MGLFSSSKKTLGSKEILGKFQQVSWLSSGERGIIMKKLSEHKDFGGVTEHEFKTALKDLERSGEISKSHRRRLERDVLS